MAAPLSLSKSKEATSDETKVRFAEANAVSKEADGASEKCCRSGRDLFGKGNDRHDECQYFQSQICVKLATEDEANAVGKEADGDASSDEEDYGRFWENDSDEDGDVLSIASVSDAVNGSVAIAGDEINFAATAGFVVSTDIFAFDLLITTGNTFSSRLISSSTEIESAPGRDDSAPTSII